MIILLLSALLQANSLESFAIVPMPKSVVVNSTGGLGLGSIGGLSIGEELDSLVLPHNLSDLPRRGDQPSISVVIDELGLQGEEGYELSVKPGSIRIRGESVAGAFYGLQTLSQLMEDAKENSAAIPFLTIRDWPDIDYRAVHFDTKHHLDTMDSYYAAIDRLAGLKVNAIVWEFEDKLRYRLQPKVGASHAISMEEMQALTHYARRRFIEISPLVQGLGHASFILKHPNYKHLRDDPNSDWAFCPIDEGTYEVLFDLYRDAIEATPGARYLHIGGDEVRVGKSELAKASGLDTLGLHLHWLNRVNDFLVDLGRTPIMWDDMPLKHGGVYASTHKSVFSEARSAELWEANREGLDRVVEMFPKEAVYMRWSYTNPGLPGNKLALDWYRDGGLNAMAATAAQTRWPLFPRNDGNVGPIREFCRMTAQRGLAGILCTAWDDDSPHMAFYWRGWTPFADFSWNSEGRDEQQALMAFTQRAYGAKAAESAHQAYRALEQAMNFWDTALVSSNRRNVCQEATMNKLIALPELETRDQWLKQNAAVLAKVGAGDLTQAASIAFHEVLNKSVRNRHELSLCEHLSQLPIHSQAILVLLKEWSENPTQDVIDRIRAWTDQFTSAWNELQVAYSHSRIPNNPPDYLLDQNHHAHQANHSNELGWMVAVELKFRDDVLEWLKDK
jgi:hexosaminidase